MDVGKYMDRIAPIDHILNEVLVEFPQVKIFNPRDLFCDESKCRGSDGRLPYYYNGDHLNHHGADLVIDNLMKYISDSANR
jgi:lysophospholipase L1-like esterase